MNIHKVTSRILGKQMANFGLNLLTSKCENYSLCFIWEIATIPLKLTFINGDDIFLF